MRLQSLESDAKARVVRRLHLRVPREEDSARTKIALEDGLATADFGDAGRLVLVRQLTLPRLVGDLNGPMAARAIEASYRALLPTAVHGGDPRAPTANVVWFEDRLEALLEALSICVNERPLDAWFWRQALGRPALGGSADAVPALFQAIADYESPGQSEAVGLLALARRWRRWSIPSFTRFLRLLPAALLESADLPIPPVAKVDGRREGDTRRHAMPAPALKVIDEARARIRAAAEVDLEHAAWVTHLELAAAGVAPSEDSMPSVGALVASVVEGTFQSADPTAKRVRAEQPLEDRNAEPPMDRVSLSSSSIDSTRPAPVQISPAFAQAQSTATSSAVEVTSLALPPWLSGASASAHGGFFMLLNAWHALGFHDWMAAQAPELRAAIARAWLERWAMRLRVPADDPQQLVWQQLPKQKLSVSCSATLRDWTVRTRRWLRTRALIGPASLVLRPGAVCVTRTHVDVMFPLQEVDLRVRRAGLDLDPGWVAWLGRIVTFHFIDE